MKLSEHSVSELQRHLKNDGVVLRIGPFSTRIQSSLPDVAAGLHLLYPDYTVSTQDFADFHVEVLAPFGVRKWFRPQVDFSFDGVFPFKPLPREQAFPMLEWGLNWCISAHAHQYLIIHAAVVEKNGLAVILPAPPGSGKSTLCAGLVSRGWRLFSDELALATAGEAVQMVPVPRPVSLKNRSIDVMRSFAPDAVIGPVAHDTAKGSVAHMRAPAESVKRNEERAPARCIVFPQFQVNASTVLEKREKSHSFMEIARQSFNYNILGRHGFDLLRQIITQCDCYRFAYSDLDEAVACFDKLVET